MKIGPKLKAIVAAVGTVITAVSDALADNLLGLDETATLASTLVLAAGTVYAVWRVPNRDER
ncbi:hypothetical protein [Amycolatopsis cihanbeyliensis]|uniref:Uncharacterized protein n=1 Tax=Amycolatopsis cihanbeyliensis TaxID=1128664 RepID=A0A542DMH1_AMYCI|nr:hypothetical protein [Amycolatopsis cihanbeyliensis]TQJ04279.1 hypothetical protein FB471_4065 [Amycolatopsis cihanbeyliensis]